MSSQGVSMHKSFCGASALRPESVVDCGWLHLLSNRQIDDQQPAGRGVVSNEELASVGLSGFGSADAGSFECEVAIGFDKASRISYS